MSGYLFIGTSNNRIYNSDLNTPTAWQALSFLTVADHAGALMWLARCKNYLVAFKQYSIEFYEDTGNPTPGSPLTAQKQLNRKVGLAAKSSVKEVSDGIIFLGISEHGKVEMYKLFKETLELKIISNQYMETMLSAFTAIDGAYSVDPKATGSNTGEAQILNYLGREFYLIYAHNKAGSARTWVYDNDLGTWVRWASSVTGTSGSPYFLGILDNNFTPTQSVLFIKSGVTYNLMAQNFLSAAGAPPYFVSMAHSTTSFGDSAGVGASVIGTPFQWVSDIIDFGSRKRKFIDSVEVLYDRYDSSGDADDDQVSIQLMYRDASISNTSQVTRTKKLPGDNKQRVRFTRCGSCRKRTFALSLIDSLNSYPFRIWGIEVEYNIGETDQEG